MGLRLAAPEGEANTFLPEKGFGKVVAF